MKLQFSPSRFKFGSFNRSSKHIVHYQPGLSTMVTLVKIHRWLKSQLLQSTCKQVEIFVFSESSQGPKSKRNQWVCESSYCQSFSIFKRSVQLTRVQYYYGSLCDDSPSGSAVSQRVLTGSEHFIDFQTIYVTLKLQNTVCSLFSIHS